LYLDGKYLGKYDIIPENYTKIYIPANKTNKNKIHFLLFSLKEECEILPEAAAPICFELSEAAI
jgi:hypothetical protein